MSAGRDELRQADARARSRAQREFAAPLVLEAGAGTGKTATLVARVVAWCLGPGWQRAAEALAAAAPEGSVAPERVAQHTLSRVVAITFTEAAAAEMAARVEQALVAVEGGEPVRGLDADALPEPSLAAERAAALRAGLEQLVVQTLHAYARRLLAAHPFEAGLHPHLEVDAEGREQAEVVRSVLAERLRASYAEEGDALLLATDGHGPHELELELLALLESGVRAEDLAGDPLAEDRCEALVNRLREPLDAFVAASDGRLPGASRSKQGVRAARCIESLRAAAAGSADVARVRELADTVAEDEGFLRRVRDWSRGRFNQDEQRVLDGREQATQEAARDLVPRLAHLAALDLDTLVRGQRLLAELLADVQRELDRRGVATFASLLSRAATLLEARPDVARSLRRGIDQLLVDEFQDTDPLQCAIVGCAGARRRGRGAPGSLPGRRSQAVDLRLAQRRPGRLRALRGARARGLAASSIGCP